MSASATPELQAEALAALVAAIVEMPISRAILAQELGINPITLIGWMRQSDADPRPIANPRIVIRAVRDLRKNGRMTKESEYNITARVNRRLQELGAGSAG